MATKTISIDLEAYDRLAGARLTPGESFSRVIKRAEWQSAPRTLGRLLNLVRETEPLPESVLDRLEAAQREDAPPDDPGNHPTP
ncbi:MAG TPA: antitoxin VapB family protein [Chthoniobacterales bacterium]